MSATTNGAESLPGARGRHRGQSEGTLGRWHALLSVLLMLLAPRPAASVAARHKIRSNVTQILDSLLHDYDNRLRPGYGGPPTVVKTDINIRSMGPISEADMTYSMDAYFRQTWVDRRLQFPGPHQELAVHIKLLERIWKPDTFFYNGRGSYLHTITTPNKLLRIKKDGTILYSMRLTIKASCPMYLHYFPVDEQSCPLQFGSYAYTRDQLEYVWQYGPEMSIKTAEGLRLSQFDLGGHPAFNQTVRNRDGNAPGEFSTLVVNFKLQRHMGYFLIQVYVPCTLIVVLSWVSFWINREATADRIGLGITTVLTLTTLSMDTRDDLPKVHYATALDWFVLMCFGFVIATILEYAGVHYFTKIGSGEIYHETDSEDEREEAREAREEREEWASREEVGTLAWQGAEPWHSRGAGSPADSRFRGRHGWRAASSDWRNNTGSWKHNNSWSNDKPGSGYKPYTTNTNSINHVTNHLTTGVAGDEPLCPHNEPEQRCNVCDNTSKDSCIKKFMKCMKGNADYRKLMMKRSSKTGVNTVSMIDKVSRILFPFSFIVLNVIYWIAYTR